MNPRDLKNQIKKGESDTIEFKESFNEEAIQTLGAFVHFTVVYQTTNRLSYS